MQATKIFSWGIAAVMFINIGSLIAPGIPTLEGDIPAGYNLVTYASGVELYTKDFEGGSPNFIQVINLSEGAEIHLLNGDVFDPGTGQGVYGGDNPSFSRQPIQQAWDQFSSTSAIPFCITNGQFFSTDDDPTNLAFPLKVDGVIVSDGYGISEFPDQKLMLEIWNDRTDITLLTEEALRASTAPSIIAGLSEQAAKSPNRSVGRTFLGIKDDNLDGVYETILVFNSKTETQAGAAQALRDFGADKVIMMDGGGSSQLICEGVSYVTSERSIPQSIGVAASPRSIILGTVVGLPSFPIINEGESLDFEITIKNTGPIPWGVGEYQLVKETGDWEGEETHSDFQPVLPGETITYSFTTEIFPNFGLYSSTWALSLNGEKVSTPIKISIIVIPAELQQEKKELERKIEEWKAEQFEQIEDLIKEWLLEQAEKTVDRVCSSIFGFLPFMLLFAVRRPKEE